MKPQPTVLPLPTDREVYANITWRSWVWHENTTKVQPHEHMLAASPFGTPGNTLLCKETFYIAFARSDCYGIGYVDTHLGVDRWLPAQWMPRWAVRLRPTVVSVKVERIYQVHQAERWNKDYPKFPIRSNPWAFVAEVRV